MCRESLSVSVFPHCLYDLPLLCLHGYLPQGSPRSFVRPRKCLHFLLFPCCFSWYHLLYSCLELRLSPPKVGRLALVTATHTATASDTSIDSFEESWCDMLCFLSILLHNGLLLGLCFGYGFLRSWPLHGSIQIIALPLGEHVFGLSFIVLKAFAWVP